MPRFRIQYPNFWSANWPGILFVLAALLLTLRNVVLPHDAFGSFTHYNNYVIFKQSFYHLLHGTDLYQSYPAEQFDVFKYTPTFALVFGVFAWMPDWLGLACWNLLNVLVLYAAINKLPLLSATQKNLLSILILQELITSTMNSQSNALIAGLLILSWSALEEGKMNRASVLVWLTAFIKLFGVVFFLPFLLRPNWPKAILPALLMLLLLFLLPIPWLGWDGMLSQYRSYLALLSHDGNTFVKYSVMGWLQSWFGIHVSKTLVLAVGAVLQLALVFRLWLQSGTMQVAQRALLVASLLIWLVIFNHMAESATFVIAVAGVMVWFFYTTLPKPVKLGFLLPVILFTCFGPSDIYPKPWRQLIVEDWQLKVFPCILIWVLCLWELFRLPKVKVEAEPVTS